MQDGPLIDISPFHITATSTSTTMTSSVDTVTATSTIELSTSATDDDHKICTIIFFKFIILLLSRMFTRVTTYLFLLQYIRHVISDYLLLYL